MTRNVRVTHGAHHPLTDEVGVRIETPFNREFVNDLKAEVPWEHRGWFSEEEVWWVSDEYAEFAVELVVHHYGETVVVTEDGGEEYLGPGGVVSRQERLL